jgi:hypothetical protein
MTPTGLPCSKKVAHELDGVFVHPHRVGVADPARDHERIVVVRARLLDGAVDAEQVCLLVVVEALDVALFE